MTTEMEMQLYKTEEIMDRELKWLQKRREALNLNYIAKRIGCDNAALGLWIAGKKNSRQTIIRLPEKCRPALIEFIKEHGRNSY